VSDIELNVNGILYGGWKSLQVDLSMNQLAGAFGFTATDLFPGQLTDWQIKMGDKCEVLLSGTVLITGYIDQVNVGYDATSHNIQIMGRDKTSDLVDCSFVSGTNEWKNISVESIIKRLCAPYDITVVVDDSVAADVSKKEKSFKTNEGETVSEAILRLCENKAVLPLTFGDGQLTLTRAGVTRAADTFVFGENIKVGNLNQNDMDRFSNYIVKAQSSGNDNLTLVDYTQPIGNLEDDVINRYKPIVFLSDKSVDNAGAKNLARWEARNRAGRSRSLNYVVQGWLQSNDEPWKINQIAEVKDDFLNINKEYLISDLSFSLTEGGSETSITLVHPDTYELKPESVKIKGPSDKRFDPNTQVSQ